MIFYSKIQKINERKEERKRPDTWSRATNNQNLKEFRAASSEIIDPTDGRRTNFDFSADIAKQS